MEGKEKSSLLISLLIVFNLAILTTTLTTITYHSYRRVDHGQGPQVVRGLRKCPLRSPEDEIAQNVIPANGRRSERIWPREMVFITSVLSSIHLAVHPSQLLI